MRSGPLLIGIVVLVLVYAIAWLAKLSMITYLLELVFTYGAFAALIIFQPELRAGLAHLGQSRVTRLFRRMEEVEVADEVTEAVERLTRSGIGAIIVLEREMALGDYVESGSEMQANPIRFRQITLTQSIFATGWDGRLRATLTADDKISFWRWPRMSASEYAAATSPCSQPAP